MGVIMRRLMATFLVTLRVSSAGVHITTSERLFLARVQRIPSEVDTILLLDKEFKHVRHLY